MKSDRHTDYEKLVQEVYEALHRAEGLETTEISHDVRLKGRSGCYHQIDVYWEFQMVGELWRVAIECKNYLDKVEIRNVRDFFGVLHDLGGIKGIFVTKVGYDSGALSFADYYSISLKEVRFPERKDWEGRLKTVDLGVNLFNIRITSRIVRPDGNWLLKAGLIREDDTRFSFSLADSLEPEVCIYDSAGEKVNDFYNMKCQLLGMQQHWEEQYGRQHNFHFEDGFIDTKDHGRIKITDVLFTYDYVSASQNVIIEGEEIAKAIIRDVKSGKIKLIDKQGNIRE